MPVSASFMRKTLDDLHAEFSAVMDQLLHHLAHERGYDLSQGLAPNLRDDLQEEGGALYTRWCGHREQDGACRR
jgi:hypothetical protein